MSASEGPTTSDGSGSGSDGGSSLSDLLPYVDFLVEFARNPARYVREVIAKNLFKGAVTVGGFVLALVAKPFEVLEVATRYTWDAIIDATGPVGSSITGAIRDINWSIGMAFSSAFGLGAPIVIWTLMVVEMMLLLLLIRYLLKVVNPS